MLTHTKIDYKNRTKEVICSASIVSILTLVTLVLGNNLRNNYQKKKKKLPVRTKTQRIRKEKKKKKSSTKAFSGLICYFGFT